MQSWGYLSGLLRAEKVHSLTNNNFSTYIDTPDIDSLSKLLEDTVYGSIFQGREIKEFVQVFDQFYREKIAEIKRMIPCPIVINLQALKYDLNNLKLCYKARLLKKDIAWDILSEEGTILPERMFAIVEHELWNELPIIVAQALILLSESSNIDMRKVDFLIDKAYYTHRLEILKKARSYQVDFYKDILNLYRMEIDCENIKNIFRAKKMNLERDDIFDIIISGGYISAEFFQDNAHLAPEDTASLIKDTAYGETFSYGIDIWLEKRICTVLEKQIDEFLLDRSSDFSYFVVGPAVVEEALRSLLIEIKNLKLIIIGKINNMSNQEIKERVRNVRS